MNEKIVIIGAGPAGIEAAATAANYSDDVTLVASSLVGEWKHADTSVWLNIVGAQSAFYSENKQSELLSIIHERAVEARNDWSNTTQKLLEELGVKLVYGIAEFVSSTCVQVLDQLTSKHQTIKADKIIIATGSRPTFPDEMKPDGRQIFSYHTLNQMKTLPKSMLIVGDGAIGFEAVNLFSRLNIEVTWLVPGEQPKSPLGDRDIDTYLINEYEQRGVEIIRGKFVSKIVKEPDGVFAIRADGSTYRAEKAFVTLGFRPNVDTMNIETAGLQLNKYGSIECNDYGQTKVPSIYIVGDAHQPIAAVYAMAKARTAALHSIGQSVDCVNINKIPLSFNEYPQVAAVGNLGDKNQNVKTKIIPFYKHNFRAHVLNEKDGFIKIVLNKEGIIIGGSVVGNQAKELITIIALLIEINATSEQLSSFFGAHPSSSEALFHAFRHSY